MNFLRKHKMNLQKKNIRKKTLLLWVIMIAVVVSFFPYTIMSKIRQMRVETQNGNSRSDDSGMVDPVSTNEITRLPKRVSDSNPKFHVAVTASDTPYSNWQCRIMYYWYKRFKDEEGSDMGGFTRVLHSGMPDNLTDEIPTFVVEPLPNGLDKGYVVLNRPWAFVQWLARAEIEEEYILMGEPDHIFVKPLPNLSNGSNPVAYPFFYIRPIRYEHLLRKFYLEEMGPITNIDPIGSSPVIITKALLKEIAPTWVNISLQIKDDPEADRVFGWVQEMYAYAIAAALHGVKHNLQQNFMTQPPYEDLYDEFIIHYTYGLDFTKEGEMMPLGERGDWSFNKRTYLDGPVPRNLTLPPPGVPGNVVRLVKMLNEATSNIPDWDSL